MKSRRSIFTLLLAFVAFALAAYAQETTAGLQGTVKDSSGAVLQKAHVSVAGSTLIGTKEADTDANGYYRFANLPPGSYTITVTAKGFETSKRPVTLEVGRLPVVDFNMVVGATTTVVEVTAAAPVIDPTTNSTQTSVTHDIIENVPHGQSFQSMIQFSPMARNEPLLGGSSALGVSGSGGILPGSGGNGQNVGYSIGGASDSENGFLVEGQDTENISGGISQANVPFEFIQEVQVKTSGLEAEHGGALGGVVNVIMKKGGNAVHGEVFATYEADGLDGSPNGFLQYDPNATGSTFPFDAPTQYYQRSKDHYRNVQPGFVLGGPMIKDRIWYFVGFAPNYVSRSRTVNFSTSALPTNAALGNQTFTQDNQTYFTTARIDAVVTQKIRVFGSWLYQYSRESGDSLPEADSVNGMPNTTINAPVTAYSHGFGFSAPNATYNVGADITLTPKIVATTRYGYFFNNYHDFGWPNTGVNLFYENSGQGATDNLGNPLINPGTADLNVPAGTSTTPYDQAFTEVNANKHYQFNQDVAIFKSGWWGTHNFKFGYQLNHLVNVINQHGNVPLVDVYLGNTQSESPGTLTGNANCALLAAVYTNCAGQYGYVRSNDFATVLKTPDGRVVPASDWNHGFFVQDSWTIGHGLTLNLGVRFERETLPAPSGLGAPNIRTIDFGWGDKIAPRLGATWGSASGKFKIFGGYGVINDVMKLLLAQTSFGAQNWDRCFYALGPDASGGFSNSDLNFVFGPNLGRSCPTGPATTGAFFTTGTTPPPSLVDAATGVSLIENTNLRPQEPVAPGLKPYRQHEYTIGADWQISRNWALEGRYDRRRLDHAIEDASLADPNAFEIYSVVNPGQGVNSTFDGYAAYLASLPPSVFGVGFPNFNASGTFGTCPTCPHMPQAVRNYDGLELRLMKSMSKTWIGSWAGTTSWTYSSLWGNYAGLTTSDQSDGGISGRNSPDTSRSFDEPFYYFTANGTSSNGPLPTDRPNTFKGDVYYQIPWRGMTTTIGIFQTAYQGSPVSTFADLGYGCAGCGPFEATYIFGRGEFAPATQDAAGNFIWGAPHEKRTPWFNQTDLQVSHSFKVNRQNEKQVLTFTGTFTNLLNQHAVTSYWQGANSDFFTNALFEFGIFNGASFYQQVETGYNPTTAAAGMTLSSQYGQPYTWQQSRRIRLGVSFRF